MPVQCPHCKSSIAFDGPTPRDVVCASCGSSVQLDPGATTDILPEEAPKRLGRFEFLEKLGTGAFGAVYKARDTELDRLVAVKIPRSNFIPQSQDMERFLREAKSAAQLKHRGIVSLYDAGLIEGTCCLVSEFIQGATLSERLSGKRYSFHAAAALLVEVADALQYAHEQGVVHRDIKPSNIMLDLEGRPHLMDFGLAKRATDENSMTLEGQVLGTPAYMSPEQARGEVSRIDARSDIYSLGVILYELLTGELPFHGQMRMLLVQVMQDEPRPPRRLNDRIPRDLETICLKAMSKEPQRRYQSARELADDLRRYLKGEPIQARPLGRMARTWRWCRRNRLVASLIAAIAVLLVAGASVATYFAIDATLARNRADAEAQNARNKAQEALDNARKADEERAKALLEKERADREADAARANLYVVRLNTVQVAIDNANLPLAGDLLQQVRQSLEERKQPVSWEWHYHWRLCHNDLRALRGHTDDINHLAVSPDGTRIASCCDDRTVRIWDPATGQQVHSIPVGNPLPLFVAFSSDGARLAVASNDGSVRIVDGPKWTEPRVLKAHAKSARGLAFHPDGKRLFTAGEDNTLKIWDVAKDQVLATFTSSTGYLRCVAISPDGKQVVVGNSQSGLQILDANSAMHIKTLNGHAGGAYGVAYSPDGKRIVSGGKDRNIKIWDVASGAELHMLTGHTGDVKSVAYSPDGSQVASASSDQRIKVWDAESGDEIITWIGHTRPTSGVAYSPDGRWVASAGWDKHIKLWDIAFRPGPRILNGHTDQVRMVKYSPDGRRLASVGLDGQIKVWDAVTGRDLHLFKERGTGLLGMAFSPDSRLIAACGDAGIVTVWDTETGLSRWSKKGHTSWLSTLAFSPDGRWLASGSRDKNIQLWNVATGKIERTITGHKAEVKGLVFSPDGTKLYSGAEDSMLMIWDLAGTQQPKLLKGHERSITDIALSKDGRWLVSSGSDQTIRIWDLAEGGEPRSLHGHHDAVWSVAISPDGARIVSASWDATVRLWDRVTGLELTSLKGHSDRVLGVAFSPDGSRIASAGGKDQSVRIWDGRPMTPETQAERDVIGLLDFLFARPLRQSDVIDYLRTTAQLAPAERQKALALAERYSSETDANRYCDAAWPSIRHPHANDILTRFALAQAKAAISLAPDSEPFRFTLGVAQFRAGRFEKERYAEALATLNKCDQTRPITLLFLAMTNWQLGDKDKARSTFDRAIQMMEMEKKEDAFLKELREEAGELVNVKK